MIWQLSNISLDINRIKQRHVMRINLVVWMEKSDGNEIGKDSWWRDKQKKAAMQDLRELELTIDLRETAGGHITTYNQTVSHCRLSLVIFIIVSNIIIIIGPKCQLLWDFWLFFSFLVGSFITLLADNNIRYYLPLMFWHLVIGLLLYDWNWNVSCERIMFFTLFTIPQWVCRFFDSRCRLK